MSRDHDREEQKLRGLLQGIRRGEDPDEIDDELLHVRPKPKPNKKKKQKERDDS